ncbi:hypothetical protein GCK32_001507 [Trichostrongylus colubriformis]|uniref:Uncharacterized protein n=1 Tax=Trichostrongylus colubriformis TaxID=6319 RepID=A0AAN8GAJ2_TRICO
MKENMQKLWQWFRDRKTHTIRKWRSTLVRRSTENGIDDKRNKRVGHSVSDINLPSTSKDLSPEYEQFFDEPRTKDFLDSMRLLVEMSTKPSKPVYNTFSTCDTYTSSDHFFRSINDPVSPVVNRAINRYESPRFIFEENMVLDEKLHWLT